MMEPHNHCNGAIVSLATTDAELVLEQWLFI